MQMSLNRRRNVGGPKWVEPYLENLARVSYSKGMPSICDCTVETMKAMMRLFAKVAI
jgi:hypothetical protein